MEIIPAIDIMGGRCVQLVGGDPKTRKDYGDPVDVARKWTKDGAGMLHLIDLDATLGFGDNTSKIIEIKKACGIPCEVGGGIRSLDAAQKMLDALGEEDKIIVGTMAVSEYPDFTTIKKLERDRVIVSVDSKGGYVTIKGWTEKSKLKATQLMSALSDHVWGYLYTNVDVEGRMSGIDEDAVKDVISATEKPVIVSGGITSKEDVTACDNAGAWGVVLGKALYESKISLKELI